MPRNVRLIRSPISVAGMVLTTISAVVFLVVFLADLFGMHSNPYVGMLFFLILPAIFLIGLALIPLGAWLARRRIAAGKEPTSVPWPRIDLNQPRHRAVAVAIFALTMTNIVIVSLAAYRGIEYMDSVAFCGQVCHTVMKPEFVAHQDGPHSRVACVQCHVGRGATSFAQSKLSGTRQLVALVRNEYPRPIPAPVQTLGPARIVCEQCHWPNKPHGDKLRTIREYGDDDKNTLTTTQLELHLGTGDDRAGASGIHWHVSPDHQIEYIATDETRQVIPYVRLTLPNGRVREYRAEGVTQDQLDSGHRRRMDCLDCHNRPSHQFAVTAERAVNQAIAAGDIPVTVPFIRREAVRVLKLAYPSQDVAAEHIATALRGFYTIGSSSSSAAGLDAPAPPSDEVERAIRATQRIYRRNVFPDMNVRFGTYPNHIGHNDSPGCFRCHDESHTTADGKTISQDCETCHAMK